ncbi:MAG: flagellin, partial [Pedosphaera sp.]|nr:flagellin [Pedosphaera sp.]
FVKVDPILTGENPLATKSASGSVVVINKSVQDISAFATELSADYDNVNLNSVAGAQIAIDLVKKATIQIATDRAKLGAMQSRLNFTHERLTVTKENLSVAISRIADVDVAEEATQYARYQILVQSGTSMLREANAMPQAALKLLQ